MKLSITGKSAIVCPCLIATLFLTSVPHKHSPDSFHLTTFNTVAGGLIFLLMWFFNRWDKKNHWERVEAPAEKQSKDGITV